MPSDSLTLRTARRTVAELFGAPEEREFDVRYWTGLSETGRQGNAQRFTLVLRRQGALGQMFVPPTELTVTEAYVRGDFDIEGNVEAATAAATFLAARLRSPLRLRVLPACSCGCRVKVRTAPQKKLT